MSRGGLRSLSNFVSRPFLDLFHGQARCLAAGSDLVWMLVGLATGWWVYVPLHELLHAAGCVLTGGKVERLELAPLYGGGVLAAVFPWVEAGGEYAGRLAAFDTGGSDWTYLATDLAPFVLALFPGVWALRLAARAGRSFAFGAVLPFAFAPLLSLTGDAYEIGSLLIVQVPPWAAHRGLLLGDDLVRVGAATWNAAVPAAVRAGFLLAALAGATWAFGTYLAASGLASLLGQRPLLAPVRVPRDDDEDPGEETLYGQ